MADACLDCGSELVGAKKFCIICGSPVREEKKPAKREPKSTKAAEGESCEICGDEASRICYFCDKNICRSHSRRLQPNRMHLDQWRLAVNTGSFADINNNWTGRLIYTCSRCFSMKFEKELSEDDRRDQGCFQRCNWYEVQ